MKLRKFVLLLSTISFFFLFISGFVTIGSYFSEEKPKDNKSGEYNNFGNVDILEARSSLPPVNLLILGVDEDGFRSDVMILINYDTDSNKINILSIPRDTRVYVDGTPSKINALIGIGGEELAISGIKELTGIEADYYLTLNFKGFRKIVDVLGGVEVDVPISMHYDDPTQNLHIHLQKGRQLLNGNKAEQFIRYRKGNSLKQGYNDGDLGRIKAQQSLIRELVRQKLKLKYLSKADDIFMILKKYFKTNANLSDFNKYISELKDISESGMSSFTIPGESKYIDDVWYFIVNVEETRKIVKQNFIK